MALPHFWHSVLLYINRPNLINRRYIGMQVISSWIFEDEKYDISSLDDKSIWESTTLQELQTRLNLRKREGGSIEADDLTHLSHPILLVRKLFPKQSIKSLKKNATESPSQSNVSEYDVVILFPVSNCFALISISFDEKLKTIHLKLGDSISYLLERVDSNADSESDQLNLRYLFGLSPNYWLENLLKPKLQKWMLESLEPKSDKTFQGSIKMISVETYCMNYNRMKGKYSVALLDIWSKVERTDPLKFIFEDIGKYFFVLFLGHYLFSLTSEFIMIRLAPIIS